MYHFSKRTFGGGSSSSSSGSRRDTRESAHQYATAGPLRSSRYSLRRTPGAPPDLVRNQTMPAERALPSFDDDTFDDYDIKRSSSMGGLPLLRGRTREERERVSRERAMGMSELWERNENRDDAGLAKMSDTSVRHKSTHYKSAPSLAMGSARDAAEAFASRAREAERNRSERDRTLGGGGDPLLAPSERAERERREARERKKKEARERKKECLKKEKRERVGGGRSTAEMLVGGAAAAAPAGVSDATMEKIRRFDASARWRRQHREQRGHQSHWDVPPEIKAMEGGGSSPKSVVRGHELC